MTEPVRAYPAGWLLAFLIMLLMPTGLADPRVAGDPPGSQFRLATWDFTNGTEYAATDASLAPGNATLGSVPGWRNYTSDAEFVAARDSAIQTVVNNGVRLAGITANLIVDGTFDLDPGPWTYTNGTTGNVTASRDATAKGKMAHDTPRVQFDSMDDCCSLPTPNWTGVSAGGSSATSQDSGWMRDDLMIVGGGWSGASRDDAGTWDWSQYNRLATWLEGSSASGVGVYIHLQNLGGANMWDSGSQPLSSGWRRYTFDLSGFFGDITAVDRFDLRFSGPAGTYTTYVDDIVLFNYSAFDEVALISQTFTKPTPTSGNPHSVVLTFDLQATAAANVNSWVQASVAGSFEWGETPVLAGTRNVYVDLGGNAALRGTGSFVLEFALQLTRTGTEEASLAVWIDNIRITAADFQSGSFTSLAVDSATGARWLTANLQTTTPVGTSVAIETRTGNTTPPGDATWTLWQPVVAGNVQSPANRYLQWQLNLNTANGSETPVVTRLDLSFEKSRPSANIETSSFFPPEPLVAWRTFFANDTRPSGTAILYELSLTNGVSWTVVTDGQNVTAYGIGRAIVRVFLSTANTSVTPIVHSVALRYEYSDVLFRIVVAPPLVVLTADDAADFTATGYDRFGHEVPVSCTWDTTDEGKQVSGNGTQAGHYEPVRAGTWVVVCFNSDRTSWGNATVVVSPGRLARIGIVPPAALVSVSQTQGFTATGYDGDDNVAALTATEWSTTIGQIVGDATSATLQAPPEPGSGIVTATNGTVSGTATVVVDSLGTPQINGSVPDVYLPEDSGAYSWDLAPYAGSQPDPNDTPDKLKWYLTGADPSLYSVFGQDIYGRHTIVLTPVENASGVDDVVLWLEDAGRARSSQALRIHVVPANDAPVFIDIPHIYVKCGEPYLLDWSVRVYDSDTPLDRLTLVTDQPTYITTDGLIATYNFPCSMLGLTRFPRHRVSDGALSTERPVPVHVTDNPPVQVRAPLPDLTIPEDTKVEDVFGQSLQEYFTDPEGETLFFSYNFTNLIVEIWNDGGYWQVNVTGKRDFCGDDRITFRATDARNAFAEYTVHVRVTCVNDPPVLAWSDDVHVQFDRPYRLELQPFVNDVDNPRDSLVLSTNDTEGAVVDRLAVTFLYTRYRLGPLPEYRIPVTLTLSDGADSDVVPITVVVSDNRPPELVAAFEDLRFEEDTVPNPVNLATHFADVEDPTLTYRVTGAHVGTDLAVTVAGPQMFVSSARDWFGTDAFVIRAEDSRGAFAVATMLVDVTPVNDAPGFTTPIPVQSQDRGGTWILDLRPYVSDVDNDIFELTFATDSPNAVAVGYLLVFTYPDQDYNRQIVVTVRDPGNLTAAISVTVRVQGPNLWGALLPWAGFGALAVAVVGYVAWTRFAARRFSIEDLFLVGREGRLIMHTTRRLRADRDPDILTGMLTAIMLFVRDSFKEENEDLKRFEFGDRMVAVERSDHVFCAAIFAGEVPKGVSFHLNHFLADVEDRYTEKLVRWSGDVEDLPGLKAMMEDFGRRGKWRVGDWKKLEAQVEPPDG